MPTAQPAQTLSTLRFAIGAGAWFTPNLSAKIFGLDPDANPQAAYLGRLFGVRDFMLGVGVRTGDTASRRLWWQVGIACDVADAAAGYLAGRNGSLPKHAAVMVTGTAIVAAGLGAAALAAEG